METLAKLPSARPISNLFREIPHSWRNFLTGTVAVKYPEPQESLSRDFLKPRYCTISQIDIRHAVRPCRRFLFGLVKWSSDSTSKLEITWESSNETYSNLYFKGEATH
jgi:hypothetical protein